MNQRNNLYFVVLGLGKDWGLDEAIKSLDGYSVVFVDNGMENSDKYKNKVTKYFKPPKNLGFTGGNNLGIRYSLSHKAEYIILLNQDAWIEKEMVMRLLNVAKRDRKIGILGPVIITRGRIYGLGGELDKNRYTAGLKDHGGPIGKYSNQETDFISGTVILIKREVLNKIGYLDENYFFYYEDVDLCVRARKAGYKCVLVGDAVAHHDVAGGPNPIREYYLARNHLLFVEKHAPWRVKLREFIRLPKTVWEHYSRKEYSALQGIRDYFLRRFGEKNN